MDLITSCKGCGREFQAATEAAQVGGSDGGALHSQARADHDRAVILTDSARFAVDDADPLVTASFACPYCLENPARTIFNLEEPNGSAILCRCADCRTSWVVAVNAGQALRLAIAPPVGLKLETA